MLPSGDIIWLLQSCVLWKCTPFCWLTWWSVVNTIVIHRLSFFFLKRHFLHWFICFVLPYYFIFCSAFTLLHFHRETFFFLDFLVSVGHFKDEVEVSELVQVMLQLRGLTFFLSELFNLLILKATATITVTLSRQGRWASITVALCVPQAVTAGQRICPINQIMEILLVASLCWISQDLP